MPSESLVREAQGFTASRFMPSRFDDNSIIVPTRRSDTDDGSPDVRSAEQETVGPWRVIARVPDLSVRVRGGSLAALGGIWSWIPPKSRQISLIAASAAALVLLGIWLGRMTGATTNRIDDWADLPRASAPGMPVSAAPKFRPVTEAVASEPVGSSTKILPGDFPPSISLPEAGNAQPRLEPSTGPLMPGTVAPSTNQGEQAPYSGALEGASRRPPTAPAGSANRQATLSDPTGDARIARRNPQPRNVSGDYPSHALQDDVSGQPSQPTVTGARPLSENDRP